MNRRTDLVFLTSTGRLIANILVMLGSVHAFESSGLSLWGRYGAAMALAVVVCLVFSVAVPTAIALYFGEAAIAAFVRVLHGMHVGLMPLTAIMHWMERLVRRAAGTNLEPEPEQLEKDILSVVEEGEKDGIVDTQEREMIESVIEFRDTQVGQIMTARPEIVALEHNAAIEEVKRTIEESGHSRIPVYDGTLDHIIGILYARDVLKHLGQPPEQFDMRAATRAAMFVPETKPLRDLLRDFRQQKAHIAIVLDEYGGTAGLVTIEDILEELVGEISDERQPEMLKRVGESAFEADARLRLDEANREVGLNLPEDGGYETLGGFVSATLGQIPQKGTIFEHAGARFTILEAEPQRVNRLRIELLGQGP
jgi:CBS domain containing-hemolysin-like protein